MPLEGMPTNGWRLQVVRPSGHDGRRKPIGHLAVGLGQVGPLRPQGCGNSQHLQHGPRQSAERIPAICHLGPVDSAFPHCDTWPVVQVAQEGPAEPGQTGQVGCRHIGCPHPTGPVQG